MKRLRQIIRGKMINQITEAVEFIKSKIDSVPNTGLVLGSGLGVYVDTMEDKVCIPYDEIPHFTKTTVVGHKGQLVFGKVKGVGVAVLQGRFHVYEGHDLNKIVFPVRVLGTLGIKTIILTNAAGGLGKGFAPGDLVCISDHLNLMGKNPLIGANIDELGPRFPDMSTTYNPELINMALECAQSIGVELKKGVYAGFLGPTYETPAEINMVRVIGGDMVGMSTVPEAIAANHMGLNIIGISCITNFAAGISQQALDHEEVKEVANLVKNKFSNLLTEVVGKLG